MLNRLFILLIGIALVGCGHVYAQKNCSCNRIFKAYNIVKNNINKGIYSYPAIYYKTGLDYKSPKYKVHKLMSVLIEGTGIEPKGKSESYTYYVFIDDINHWANWINTNCKKKCKVEILKEELITYPYPEH